MPEINMETIAASVEQGNQAIAALRSKHDELEKEVKNRGSADPLTKESMDKINMFLDGIADIKQSLTLKQAAEKITNIENVLARREKGGSGGDDNRPEAIRNHDAAMRGFLRRGIDVNLAELQAKAYATHFNVEEKALSVGSDPDGGYLVTPQMSATVIKNVFESSPVRAVASVETISTDALEMLDDHNEAASGWTTETASPAETNTPQLAVRRIPTHEQYAKPRATQKLLDDAFINVESWLAAKVADIFARKEALAFVSGTGVGQPRGILTYAAGTAWGQIEQINSGTSGAITSDGLIKLFYGLKSDYAQNATFMMNRLSVRDVRLLKENTTNQYIWQPGLQAGQPDLLLGRPVLMATDVPVAAANSLSVICGDFRRGYQIVDRMGIRILRDPYSAKPFVEFYTTKRVGGDVTNFEALKLLKLA